MGKEKLFWYLGYRGKVVIKELGGRRGRCKRVRGRKGVYIRVRGKERCL